MRLDRLLHTELYGACTLPCRAHEPCQLLCAGMFKPYPPSFLHRHLPQLPNHHLTPNLTHLQRKLGSGVLDAWLEILICDT